jgi:hypothetical protein
MTSAAERLRLLRSVLRRRGEPRAVADVAYAVYLAVLCVPIVLFPVVRVVVLALASQPVLAALRAPAVVGPVGLVLGLLLAGSVWVGAGFGPVRLEPALVLLLADTDLPRHRTLARPFLTSALVVVSAAVAVGALFSGVLVAAGLAAPAAGAGFVAAGAVYAVILAVLWLAGQAAGTRLAGLLGAAIAALAVLGLLAPAVRVVLPWGWLAASWPTASRPGAVGTVLLVLAGALAAAAVRPLLDLLRSARLVDEATRWRAARGAAVAGDVALALGGLRSRPWTGRRWRAVRAAPEPLRGLIQDVVGAARTPGRLLVGALALSLAVALLALATTVPAGWVVAAAGAALGYLALGVVSDGFRHATEAAVAPALLGYSTTDLFVRHAAAPVLVVAVVTGVGLAGVAALGVGFTPWPVILVLLLVVLIRAYDSAKGPLPAALLSPVLTPFGDLSGLNVSLWQADAWLGPDPAPRPGGGAGRDPGPRPAAPTRQALATPRWTPDGADGLGARARTEGSQRAASDETPH